jgi:hypothetical protein
VGCLCAGGGNGRGAGGTPHDVALARARQAAAAEQQAEEEERRGQQEGEGQAVMEWDGDGLVGDSGRGFLERPPPLTKSTGRTNCERSRLGFEGAAAGPTPLPVPGSHGAMGGGGGGGLPMQAPASAEAMAGRFGGSQQSEIVIDGDDMASLIRLFDSDQDNEMVDGPQHPPDSGAAGGLHADAAEAQAIEHGSPPHGRRSLFQAQPHGVVQVQQRWSVEQPLEEQVQQQMWQEDGIEEGEGPKAYGTAMATAKPEAGTTECSAGVQSKGGGDIAEVGESGSPLPPSLPPPPAAFQQPGQVEPAEEAPTLLGSAKGEGACPPIGAAAPVAAALAAGGSLLHGDGSNPAAAAAAAGACEDAGEEEAAAAAAPRQVTPPPEELAPETQHDSTLPPPSPPAPWTAPDGDTAQATQVGATAVAGKRRKKLLPPQAKDSPMRAALSDWNAGEAGAMRG